MILSAMRANIGKAAMMIRMGGLVAFPTETVYGLGASIRNSRAVAAIFEAKGRPTFNPLITHIAEAEQMNEFAVPDSRAVFLAQKFWPGPLTFVLQRKPQQAFLDLVCAGLPTMTIRCPNHPVALELIERAGVPIAAPSANRSQTLSPTTAEAVWKSLDERVDIILDGGACSVGVESTILDLTTPQAVILRAGGITKEDLEDALQETVYFSDGNPDKPTSPGQLSRHYAPAKTFRINVTDPRPDELFIAFGSGFNGAQLNLSPQGDLREAAANLFAFMRAADENKKFNAIAMAPIPMEGLGVAINDRIKRASRRA
ncbi:MAG: threonylcarbamoyl-AMP synthase [Alphaproteobacteria bacterium]|nr:threonylcarbamoyl-AMP synthase [Alphaproteobacteria bacterium]